MSQSKDREEKRKKQDEGREQDDRRKGRKGNATHEATGDGRRGFFGRHNGEEDDLSASTSYAHSGIGSAPTLGGIPYMAGGAAASAASGDTGGKHSATEWSDGSYETVDSPSDAFEPSGSGAFDEGSSGLGDSAKIDESPYEEVPPLDSTGGGGGGDASGGGSGGDLGAAGEALDGASSPKDAGDPLEATLQDIADKPLEEIADDISQDEMPEYFADPYRELSDEQADGSDIADHMNEESHSEEYDSGTPEEDVQPSTDSTPSDNQNDDDSLHNHDRHSHDEHHHHRHTRDHKETEDTTSIKMRYNSDTGEWEVDIEHTHHEHESRPNRHGDDDRPIHPENDGRDLPDDDEHAVSDSMGDDKTPDDQDDYSVDMAWHDEDYDTIDEEAPQTEEVPHRRSHKRFRELIPDDIPNDLIAPGVIAPGVIIADQIIDGNRDEGSVQDESPTDQRHSTDSERHTNQSDWPSDGAHREAKSTRDDSRTKDNESSNTSSSENSSKSRDKDKSRNTNKNQNKGGGGDSGGGGSSRSWSGDGKFRKLDTSHFAKAELDAQSIAKTVELIKERLLIAGTLAQQHWLGEACSEYCVLQRAIEMQIKDISQEYWDFSEALVQADVKYQEADDKAATEINSVFQS